jgi:ribbon-helix-helix CopG family protein
MSDKERDLAEELELTRDDSGEWSDERAQVEVRPSRSQVVSFRLPIEELDNLTMLASATGESLSDFIRRAIEYRVRHVIAPSVFVTHSAFKTASTLTVRRSPQESGRNEPDPFYVSEDFTVSTLGAIASKKQPV